MKRLWSWWQKTAYEFARDTYLDDHPAPVPSTSTNEPLSIGEKLFLMLVAATGIGWIAWNFALGDNGRITDSWIGENPITFGVAVGITLYVLGAMTILAMDRRG